MASMAEYLKRYASGGGASTGPDAKGKKKRPRVAGASGNIRIVDEDAEVYAAPTEPSAREVAAARARAEAAPVVVIDEVALRREAVRARLAADGSGWATTDGWDGAGRAGDDVRPSAGDDVSPPRRGRPVPVSEAGGEDVSPPRRRPALDPPDASPPRRRRHDSPPSSPPRRPRPVSPTGGHPPHPPPADVSPPRRRRHDSPVCDHRSGDMPPPPAQPPRPPPIPGPVLMSDGSRSGLRASHDITAEITAKRAAAAAVFGAMSDEQSGRGARTVYRDGSGSAIVGGYEELLRVQEAAKAKAATKAQERPVWGTGLVQQREAAAAAEREAADAAAPFARGWDTMGDRDAELKARVRFGDPMAHLVARPVVVAPPPVAMDPAVAAAGGFVVPQEVPDHSWLRRGMGPPGNRYSIRPGRHWDGVDRSTGFEQSLFKSNVERAAFKTEHYKWSSEDM